MKKWINNERGNGMFITIFYFFVVGIVLILLLNIVMIYTKQAQASNAAEQASFAATSVVYDKVNDVVDTHVKVVAPDIEPEPLKDKVEDREHEIRFFSPNLSNNEVHIQAVNDVLLVEIPDDDVLAGKITAAIHAAKMSIPFVVEDIIEQNGGKAEDFDIFLNEENRLEVLAKTEFDPTDYSGIDFGSSSDIPQRGIGPEISFVEESGW